MHTEVAKASARSRGGSGAVTARALLGVALTAFVMAVLVLLAVVYSGETPRPPLVLIFAGGALLAAVMVPAVYAMVLTPLRRAYDDRAHAGGRALSEHAAVFQDDLTHLPNRRGITTGLLESMAQAERYGDPLSVAVVEIDNYNKLNEMYGPRTNERVLQGMAEVFVETLRMPDKAGRYDGQEFLVVLPHTNLKDAGKIVERIRRATLGRSFEHNGHTVSLSVTIGVTQFRKGEDLEQLLSRAVSAKRQPPGGNSRRRASTKKAAKQS